MALSEPSRSIVSTALDFFAGVLVFVFVLFSVSHVGHHGFDFRVMYTAAAAGYFCAGLLRGNSVIANVWLKGLLVSAGGLFGTALLIAAQRSFRISVMAGVGVTSFLMAVAGVATRRRRSWRVAAISLAACAVLILAVVPRLSSYAGFETSSRPGPAFTVDTFDGRPIQDADLRGKVVMLAFWASWCGPCHRELPEVERVYTQFKDNPDVEVIAVDTAVIDGDYGVETSDGGKESLAAMHLDMPGAFDSGDTGRAFGVHVLPTLVLLDRDGRVRETHTGFDVSEHLDAALTARINFLLRRHE